MKEGKGKRALERGFEDLRQGRGGVLPSMRNPADVAPRKLSITNLVPNPFQPRSNFDEKEIETLTNSIKESGILQPLLVRAAREETGTYEILAGERRWRAAQRSGLHEVPVVVRDADDREAAAIALIENIQRSDLNPLEEARGYRHLVSEFETGQEEVARHVGKSRSHVANMMRLLHLPKGVQAMLIDERITAGHARALLGKKNPEALARQVVAKGLNVRQTERLAALDGRQVRSPDTPDPDITALERDLRDTLGLDVRLAHRGGKGEVRISYSSLEQLEDVLVRLKRAS